ncbi:DUF3624 domain-containing protein [Motilimonas eburnea]|nr:DUF3624 domain-containing protein [Motilimonas eburnea]
MNCQRCSDWFIKKLGRCHACMFQTGLLFFLSAASWYYLDKPNSVEAIAAMFFAVASGSLFLLHILVWLVRHLTNKS